MRLKLNGEVRKVHAQTVADLLEELASPQTGVAVALNGKVVRKDEHSSTLLAEGDEVEVIRAVQGG